jgi:hypothetical protein
VGSIAYVSMSVFAGIFALSLQQWRVRAGLATGPLFRPMTRHGRVLAQRLSGEGVAIVVKRYVEKLGFDPAQFAGHSPRAGLATSAAAAGKSERAIRNQTGHRSVSTVRRYIRDGNLFRENAAGGLGLYKSRSKRCGSGGAQIPSAIKSLCGARQDPMPQALCPIGLWQMAPGPEAGP